MNPDVNSIIEDAKKRGVDMSWLHAPAPAGQSPEMGAVQRVSPGASQLMQAAQQAQAKNPVYLPFPGGTPTQRRREADESAQQFQTGHEFAREQFDWRRETDERDFAANEAYREQALALQRAKAAGSGGAEGGGPYNPMANFPWLTTQDQQDKYLQAYAAGEIEDLTAHVLRDGGGYQDVLRALTTPASRKQLAAYRVTDDMAIRKVALDSMESYLKRAMSSTHWSDPHLTQELNNRWREYQKELEKYNKDLDARVKAEAERDKLAKDIMSPGSDPNLVPTAGGFYNIMTGEFIPQ